MEPTCKYCGGSVVINKHDEWVCTRCATVLGPVYVWSRCRLTGRETALAIYYRYA